MPEGVRWGGRQTSTCHPDKRRCNGLLKKWGEPGEQGEGGDQQRIIERLSIIGLKGDQKKKNNTKNVFLEMNDVSLEGEWASPLNLSIGVCKQCERSLIPNVCDK